MKQRYVLGYAALLEEQLNVRSARDPGVFGLNIFCRFAHDMRAVNEEGNIAWKNKSCPGGMRTGRNKYK